jgi:hypothetical protein
MSWIFQRFFSPLSVRHAPDSVCGMLRIRCATYPGFTVRHAPDYAKTSYGIDLRLLKQVWISPETPPLEPR